MKSLSSALTLVALLVVSLAVGSRALPLADVLSALAGNGPADIHNIVWGMRIPRGLLACLAGGSLALAGVLAQAWTRNPLADPGIVGITAGARFAIALAAIAGVGGGLWTQGVLALLGALVATGVVLLVARTTSDSMTLILVGVGINAMLMALTMLLALQSESVFNDMRQWSVGSTVGRGYGEVLVALVGFLIAFLVSIVVARDLDILAMGSDTAAALGISVNRTLALVITALVVAAGSATAVVGPVAFLGLAAPHMVRSLGLVTVRDLLLPTVLVGSILAVLADMIGRLALRPGEVEFSVVLAAIGAPLMIWLIRKGARL
ncbi:iron ABC transporter permease [Corynebacterium sp. H127]|uniref:FecCD family ABC transporter permease n=1 Tax=Corynebacterium sp. H127 TaxID=3133418 RepID=UPI003099564F